MNLDESSLLYDKGELKVIGRKDKTCHEKNCSDSRLSITFLRVGSEARVDGPVIFMVKGTKAKPRIIGTNLVTRYGLAEGSCVIPSK